MKLPWRISFGLVLPSSPFSGMVYAWGVIRSNIKLLPQKMSQSDLYVAEYDININQTDLQKFHQRSTRQRDYDKYGPRNTSLERSTSSYQGPTRFSKDYP